MDFRRMLAAPEGSPFVLLDGYHALDHHEESWNVEKLSAEEFLVDDLLDLGGIASDLEDQMEGEEEEEIASTTSALSGQSPAVEEEESIVPEGDLFDLEWVSRIVDDSVPVVVPFVHPKAAPPQQQKLQLVPNPTVHGRAPSSLSLASVSSPAVSACRSAPKPTLARFSPQALAVPCRARTKRSRRVWSLARPDLADPLCSSSSSCSSSCSSTSSCLVYEPHAMSPEVLPLDYDPPRSRGRPPLHRKPAGEPRKKATWKPEVEEGGRRCSHCGVQKTPQWRTGSMGAKTLCNACGVRYKSGRLLPEYRPACSPTFLIHVHSNSHRKVLEMRREKEILRLSSAAPPSPAPVVF